MHTYRSAEDADCPNGCPAGTTQHECFKKCYPGKLKKDRGGKCICECHEGKVPLFGDDDERLQPKE